METLNQSPTFDKCITWNSCEYTKRDAPLEADPAEQSCFTSVHEGVLVPTPSSGKCRHTARGTLESTAAKKLLRHEPSHCSPVQRWRALHTYVPTGVGRCVAGLAVSHPAAGIRTRKAQYFYETNVHCEDSQRQHLPRRTPGILCM